MNTVPLKGRTLGLNRAPLEATVDVPAFRARVRLFVVVLLAVTAFTHLVIVVAQLALDGRTIRAALLGPDALRRLFLVLGCASIAAVVSFRPLSRRALLWLDAGAVLVVSLGMLASIPMRVPEYRPDLAALVTIGLVLVGRASLVPSSAVRTLLIGLIALAPLFIVGPLFYPEGLVVADIPMRRLARVTVFMFGSPTLAVTAVTSHVIYKLRRSVRRARTLGPYVVGRKIGEGGMGVVYEARHALLARTTALKLIKPSRIDPTSELQFEREARLMSELSHPNTVALYDYGKTVDGIYYYAMELIDGITLHDLVQREGPLPAGRALRLLRQVAASLAHAHRKDLIHRDIKHANVMVCDREGHPDYVKVLDFGLARRLRPTADPARSTDKRDGEGEADGEDVVVGTVEFMAPEAVYGAASVSPATDVYAVGVLGYFLLTGEVPFPDRDICSTVLAHLTEPPLPPSQRRTNEVPVDLERVIMTSLAKDVSQRYPDGSALLRALEACKTGDGWSDEDARAWWQARGRAAPRPRAAEVQTAKLPTITINPPPRSR